MKIKLCALLILLSAALCSGQVTIGGSNFPLIVSGPPPNCQVGVPYTFTANVSGGIPPITWSLINSTVLPAGLNLNASTGLISGNCTTPGTTVFQLQVMDAVGNFSSQQFSITVSAPLQIAPGTFPNGVVGSAYTSAPLPSASGGTLPYLWTISAGSLPTGLSISSSTGVVSGTPSGSPGTSTFTLQVADSASHVATQPNSIAVTGSSTTCGPPGYLCTSVTTAVIQAPVAPFSGGTGVNQIKCDPSINGACSSTAGIDPMVRLTDSTVGGIGFTVDISGGAGDNIFSLNDTKIGIIPTNTGGISVMGFTPSTMQTNGVATPIPFSHSISWAHTDDNILYQLPSVKPSSAVGGTTCNSPCIIKTTFSSPTAFTQSVVMDPVVACSALIPAGTYTGGSISTSFDDNIVYAAILTGQQNTPGYVFAYNQSTGKCSALYTGATTNNFLPFVGAVTTATLPCAPIGLHNSNVFLNGTWARITTGADSPSCPSPTWPQPFIWQVGTTNVTSCGVSPPALSGHNFNGWNLEVQISNPTFHWANVTSGSYCTDLLSQTYGSGLWLTNMQPGDTEVHFAANHLTAGETEPVIGGVSAANNAGTTWVAPVINEVFAFQRSPFKIQRFTHTFNSSSLTCPLCDFRDIEAIVTQSQTGKFAAFCSDMVLGLGSTSGGLPRIDVFIVRLD